MGDSPKVEFALGSEVSPGHFFKSNFARQFVNTCGRDSKSLDYEFIDNGTISEEPELLSSLNASLNCNNANGSSTNNINSNNVGNNNHNNNNGNFYSLMNFGTSEGSNGGGKGREPKTQDEDQQTKVINGWNDLKRLAVASCVRLGN